MAAILPLGIKSCRRRRPRRVKDASVTPALDEAIRRDEDVPFVVELRDGGPGWKVKR